jgi:hypothetical protein
VLVQDDAEVTGPLAQLFQRAAAVAQQVDERDALGIEQLEGEAYPLGRVLGAGEGVGDITDQILAPPQVAALIAEREPICASASLASPVPGAASAARRVKRRSAMSSVCCSSPDALAANRSSCSPSTPTDLVRDLADGIRRDRAIDQRSEATVAAPISAPPSVRMPVRSSSAWRPTPFSPSDARSFAVSMRFRLCSPLCRR